MRCAPTLVALLLALLLGGGGIAVANWASSNSGTATAKAGAITVPTGLTGTQSCSLLTSNLRIDWTAVSGASSYTVDLATNSGFTGDLRTQTVSTTRATYSEMDLLARRDVFVRVRATAGNWTSANSATLSTHFNPCVA